MKVDWSSSKWDDPTHDQDGGRGNVRTGRLGNRLDGMGQGAGGGGWEQEKVEPDSDLFSGSQMKMKVALLQREHGFGVGHGSFISDVLSLRHASSRNRDMGWRYRLENINSKKLESWAQARPTTQGGCGRRGQEASVRARVTRVWETGDYQYSRGRGLDW